MIFAHAVTLTACVFYLDLEKSVEVCYTYDKLSRVKERETVSLTGGSSSCENFIYDAAGNVTQSSKDEPGTYSTTNYTYDSLTNRLASYDGCTPTYDADGNMRRQERTIRTRFKDTDFGQYCGKNSYNMLYYLKF